MSIEYIQGLKFWQHKKKLIASGLGKIEEQKISKSGRRLERRCDISAVRCLEMFFICQLKAYFI